MLRLIYTAIILFIASPALACPTVKGQMANKVVPSVLPGFTPICTSVNETLNQNLETHGLRQDLNLRWSELYKLPSTTAKISLLTFINQLQRPSYDYKSQGEVNLSKNVTIESYKSRVTGKGLWLVIIKTSSENNWYVSILGTDISLKSDKFEALYRKTADVVSTAVGSPWRTASPSLGSSAHAQTIKISPSKSARIGQPVLSAKSELCRKYACRYVKESIRTIPSEEPYRPDPFIIREETYTFGKVDAKIFIYRDHDVNPMPANIEEEWRAVAEAYGLDPTWTSYTLNAEISPKAKLAPEFLISLLHQQFPKYPVSLLPTAVQICLKSQVQNNDNYAVSDILLFMSCSRTKSGTIEIEARDQLRSMSDGGDGTVFSLFQPERNVFEYTSICKTLFLQANSLYSFQSE